MFFTLTQQEIERIESSDKFELLSSTKAYDDRVSAILHHIQDSIYTYNRESQMNYQIVGGMALSLLERGDMYYAEASKVEICILLAKIYQVFENRNFQQSLSILFSEYFYRTSTGLN